MAKDPYQYFRVEARELLDGLTQGILQLEKGASAPPSEDVARLLRLAHTLKGAARVVMQPRIAERAHTVEGILTTYRESELPLSNSQQSELLRLLDEISSYLAAISSLATNLTPTRLPAEEPLETLRVEIQEMDALLQTITEAGVQLGALRKGIGDAERLHDLTSLLLDLLTVRPAENRDVAAAASAPAGMARARLLAEELRSNLDHFQRSLAVDLERVDGAFVEMRDLTHRLRLIPAQTVFASLERSVRDAAQTLGKRVAFDASGGEVRLDANVLASLRDALMHVVRNAVAHGVESEAERIALAKPPAGQLRLEVLRRGSRVAFVLTDDGRGIDVEAVRKVAVARGIVPAAAAKALSADQVIALLGSVGAVGLSTSHVVTELSGRGIGLDVVRSTLSQLKGEMSIRSEPGRGVRVEVQVPVSIAALQGLVVEAGGARVAIPLDAVQQTLRVGDAEVARSAEGDSILHAGKVIPFLPLELMLRRSGSGGPNLGNRVNSCICSAVVVQAGGRCVALGVERLLGAATIVMRELPSVVEADTVVAGASLDAEGTPQLVLDPAGLVAAAERSRGETFKAAAEAHAQPAPILVIDDSLTTRMLEQSILEAAGYQVELAVSAEDGLIKAHDHRYSLFIVDVEMPGMDGFGFVAQTRADPVLRDIPAILVTSRDAMDDRLRGQQVGASAFIVKGEFDQMQLLQTIRTLIGSP
ncbi:MAG: hybrid sensor histidine kinase/response regulator [Betaproteobacteria bacterium]|nr:hybrid sensor histidine kinase/response regulator [Betaproteobacteria bacterium]